MSVLNMCFTRTEHGVADFEAWLKVGWVVLSCAKI